MDGGKFNEVLVSRKRETTGYKCTSYRIRNGNFNVQTETDKKEFAKCNSQYTMELATSKLLRRNGNAQVPILLDN